MSEGWWRTEPWWKSLGRILRLVFVYIFAPMMALGIPILIAYGLLNPRTDDFRALNLGPSEIALLVGVEGAGAHVGAPAGASGGSRSYIIVPRALTDPELVGVTELNGNSVAQSLEGGALTLLLVWLACAYATWRFLLVPISRRLSMRWSGP